MHRRMRAVFRGRMGKHGSVILKMGGKQFVEPATPAARKKRQPDARNSSPAGCHRITGLPVKRSVAGEQRKSAGQQKNHAPMNAHARALATTYAWHSRPGCGAGGHPARLLGQHGRDARDPHRQDACATSFVIRHSRSRRFLMNKILRKSDDYFVAHLSDWFRNAKRNKKKSLPLNKI